MKKFSTDGIVDHFTRRDFLAGAGAFGAVSAISGCAGTAALSAARPTGDVWGALLHLGTNMWCDWTPDKVFPRSAEEEARFVAEGKITYYKKSHIYCYRDYMSVDWKYWDRHVALAKEEGLNAIFIDIGEAYAYPSHPELWVNGSLTPDEMRAMLAKIRALGMEPIPKLNFSTCHDQWLKEYHSMTSSTKYYEVVRDVIRDVCEVFDSPRYFHLGFDEEVYGGVKSRSVAVMRTGDQWWKDFNYAVKETLSHGARPLFWCDKMCQGREEFLRRMNKDAVLVTWYYGKDFSEKHMTWDKEYETHTDFSVQRNLAAMIPFAAENGFDIMPCTSNWECPEAAEAMLGWCRANVDPKRVLGYFTAPWTKPVEGDDARTCEGIRCLAAAKRKLFG